MITMYVVWEPNANVPQIFQSETAAIEFRNSRINRDRIRHPVYIRGVVVPDKGENE